jgi:hypothetical protein
VDSVGIRPYKECLDAVIFVVIQKFFEFLCCCAK